MIDPALWKKLESIYTELSQRAPEEHQAFLDDICGDDVRLRDAIQALLDTPDRTPPFLQSPVHKVPEPAAISAAQLRLVGQRVGNYRIKSMIGSGGMGTVYEAVQSDPRRTVALKVMRRGIASRSSLRRFQYEAQVLGRLRHPGIAQIYEAGTYDDGEGAVPYFAMEYIPNAKSIIDYSEHERLSIRDRLALFIGVCQAVNHGHQKGIIHRDLKPANILIDSSGRPKIIDFGVARAADPDLAVLTAQTQVGQLIGTVQYMSPEQCEADPHDLDIRSDVYTLGVVLYELLTGALPYNASSTNLLKAAQVIVESPPQPPSRTNDTLRGDVETIVLKALEKRRELRYRSAADLGDDIHRYLNSEPIMARPPSIMYQIRTFARRNRALVAVVSLLVIVLLLATLVSTALAIRASLAQQQARHEADERRLAQDQAISWAAEAENAKTVAQQQRDIAQSQAYTANIRAATMAIRTHDVSTARQRLGECPPHLRHWEWHHLASQLDLSFVTLPSDALVPAVALHPTAALVALPSDGSVDLRDFTGRTIGRCSCEDDMSVSALSFSPDGSYLLAGYNARSDTDGGAVHNIGVWLVAEPTAPALVSQVPSAHKQKVNDLAFSPDGLLLATASHDCSIGLWHVSAEGEVRLMRLLADAHGHHVISVSFSPDGLYLASASYDKSVKLWDVGTMSAGEPVTARTLMGHEAYVMSVAFDPDTDRLASASLDDTVKIWDVAGGEELDTLHGHKAGVVYVDFLGGNRLISTALDGTLRLWQQIVPRTPARPSDPAPTASVWRERSCLWGHDGWVVNAAINTDRTIIATASEDSSVRIWNTVPVDTVPTLLGHGSCVNTVAFHPSNELIASSSTDSTIMMWRLETCTRLEPPIEVHEKGVHQVIFSPDGGLMASCSEDCTVGLWSLARGDLTFLGRTQDQDAERGNLKAIAFNATGQWLGSSSGGGTVKVWTIAQDGSLDRYRTLPPHGDQVNTLVFCGEGRVVTGSVDGSVRLWDVQAGREEWASPSIQDAEVYSVALSPDSGLVASAADDGTIKLWNAKSGAQIGEPLVDHSAGVLSVAFHPDGTRLASGAKDHTIKIWDLQNGVCVQTLHEHLGHVSCVVFSPDGRRLASTSQGYLGEDNSIKIWEAWEDAATPAGNARLQAMRLLRAEVRHE